MTWLFFVSDCDGLHNCNVFFTVYNTLHQKSFLCFFTSLWQSLYFNGIFSSFFFLCHWLTVNQCSITIRHRKFKEVWQTLLWTSQEVRTQNVWFFLPPWCQKLFFKKFSTKFWKFNFVVMWKTRFSSVPFWQSCHARKMKSYKFTSLTSQELQIVILPDFRRVLKLTAF